MVQPPKQPAHGQRRYRQVFAGPGGVTALELAVISMPISKLAIGFMLVVLAATKATLVALFYMHLAVEKRTLAYIALTPAVLCVLLVFALLPDLGAFTRALTHATSVTAEAHE